MPPCALHLILSIHRCFWKIIHNFSKDREQEHIVAPALRRIGCHYMAFQMESYCKSKGKGYDGSNSLWFAGNGCKKLEKGIHKFCSLFIRDYPELNTPSSTPKIELFCQLVKLWQPVALELRSVKTASARVQCFQGNVEAIAAFLIGNFPSECSE